MFKDFSRFNSLAHLFFKDEPFSMILKAFNSFQSLLVALRTEAYDYSTWYNKIMRDKYEDGAPVDVTALPYLSVPRSQLAVIRSRIAKVKETVQYAANAITNIALGNKVEPQRVIVSPTDDVTPTISGTNQTNILNALKRITYAIGNLFVTFGDGSDAVTVNGVQLSISPLVRGSFSIVKCRSGNDARAGVVQAFNNSQNDKFMRSTSGEVLRRMCRAPLVVARSRADLSSTSQAPIGMLIAALTFFSKKIVIWAESTTQRDELVRNGFSATIFNTVLHAKIVDPSEIKSTIASSLYGYLSEDYMEAMSFNEETFLLLLSVFSDLDVSGVPVYFSSSEPVNTYGVTAVFPIYNSSEEANVYASTSDVSEATTQTAISDLFFTENEWNELESSLAEA